jgi:hypothetical protein
MSDWDEQELRQRAFAIRNRVATYLATHPTGRLTTVVRTHVLGILLERGPSTDHDIVNAYQALVEAQIAPTASPGLVRTARLGLVRDGAVEATGERRPTSADRTSAVWRRVDPEVARARARVETLQKAGLR